MTDASKLKAYMVCAAFGLPPSASLHMNACIAASSEAAVAMCVSLFHRFGGVTDEIQGVHCMELTEGFMSDALAAIRGGDKPKVVSLREVEKEAPAPVSGQPSLDKSGWPESITVRPGTVGNALSAAHSFQGVSSLGCEVCGESIWHPRHT